MSIKQHKPIHPGEFIKRTYLEPFNLRVNDVAKKLGVNPSTFSRLVNCQSKVVPAMALRLSKVIGRSPESWLLMQDNYDLHKEQREIDLSACKPIAFAC
jgi:addiction module HigA family antidote